MITPSTNTITLLMVFVLQGTQNRTPGAAHVKLDEIVSPLDWASNRVLVSEEETEEEPGRRKRSFEANSKRE